MKAADIELIQHAPPRARALLELIALNPDGIQFYMLSHVYGLLAHEEIRGGLSIEAIAAALQPVHSLISTTPQARFARILRPATRRLLLEELQDSPWLRELVGDLPALIARLDSGPPYLRHEASGLLRRLLVLGGLGVQELASIAGHEPQESLREALQDVLTPPISIARLNRLDPDLAVEQLARFLSARTDAPQDDLGSLLDSAVVLLQRGARAEQPLAVIAQAAWMCARSDVLALIPPGASLAQRQLGVLAQAFSPGSAQDLLEHARNSMAKPAKSLDALLWSGLPGLLVRLAVLAIGAAAERAKLALAQKKLQKSEVGQEADTWIGDAFDAHIEGRSWVSPAPMPAHAMLFDPLVNLRPTSALSLLLLRRWFASPPDTDVDAAVEHACRLMRDCGMHRMLAAIQQAREATAGPALWRTQTPHWQRVLDALAEIARSGTAEAEAADAGAKHSRLFAWVQSVSESGHSVDIEFLEQRQNARGWTPGRRLTSPSDANAALARVAPDNDGDRRVLRALALPQNQFYGGWIGASSRILQVLGHCSVLVGGHDQRSIAVELIKPTLGVETEPDGSISLRLTPDPGEEGRAIATLDGDTLSVCQFKPEHQRIARLLQRSGSLPAASLPTLLALTPALSQSVGVEAEIGTAQVTETDARIHVLIDPWRDGLRFRVRTHPLGEQGIYLVPGIGQRELLGVRDGMPIRGERDLGAERASLVSLIEQVPQLAGAESGDAIELPDAKEALEALAHLTELGEAVPLVWPPGKRWGMSKTRGFSALKLKVTAQRDWFHAEGGLTLEDGSVVKLATLLEALPSSQGRFLRLDGDRILALTQDLARRLHGLRALADERGKIELAPVAAGALQPLIDAGVEIDTDQAFREQLARMQAATTSQHSLPTDFQAELRDYQLEGFTWMMRLAEWGAGACLADDMGLGKTVQALAVLVARAQHGPALVVAPTSVVGNWRAEARRFAPTLEVRVYGEGDRADTLETLGPGSLLLVSYGLLTLHIEKFAPILFSTLVLDEAQAVKNAQAQRTQAIRQIQADARIATTGTPIENHLGELWSLMRILNPGLLGSQERFARRFLTPLERDPRGPEREVLRRLISPFLLRRMKSQVLDELPPRTEIVLLVEPSPGEASLLAAVRKQALERIAAGGIAAEAKRFHVLAELMRLRRAACHPSLVAPELNLTGAKLEQLLELVSELKENRHRALIFSQFTDYLAIVRKALDAQGVSYQYLDGSTSIKARETAVADFQRGVGDVFLLSLKAGGVGLNLTAADYVIHLDPWWNPAVEQQATDRAHRIGQNRPVTVYKLIVKGSIEEQILSLHGTKRELVDSVLGDQDVAKALSIEELVALL